MLFSRAQEAFKKNLNGIDGGKNLDQAMLNEIFKAVSTNEIIMPAEQTGTVRENYLWKQLLKRGLKVEGRFIHAPSELYDHDLWDFGENKQRKKRKKSL